MAKKKNPTKTKKVKRKGPKTVLVHKYPRHVKVSEKNPEGITIVDQHLRHIQGTYLDELEIESTIKNYDKKNIVYPAQESLGYPDGNKYDVLIAIWTDFFNKKFNSNPPLDPDVVKALIGGESGFKSITPENPKAIGIIQITPSTLKILQDPDGEAKNFIFKNVTKKDLAKPEVAIPMGIRWLHRKKETAKNILKHEPNTEEIILDYKGLLKSNSTYKQNALKKFRKFYDELKNKSGKRNEKK